MFLELGPVDAGDVQQWARLSRRILWEIQADPADLAGIATNEMLEGWRKIIETWGHEAVLGESTFRWSGDIDVEQAEYLLHGLDRALQSKRVRSLVSASTASSNRPFTMHVVQSFVDALSAEGRCQQHLCDQIRASLGHQLDH
jgi:hypothetical protein